MASDLNPLISLLVQYAKDKNQDKAQLEEEEKAAIGAVVLWAASRGELAVLKELLLAHPELADFKDYDKRTALHLAAAEGQVGTCRYLVLERRVDKNPVDRWGFTPLDDAVRHKHKDVIDLFRDMKNQFNPGPGNEDTTMIKAAFAGDDVEVKRLIIGLNNRDTSLKGPEINQGDYDMRTPMHLAASEGHFNVLEVLLKEGASPRIKDRWNRSPLDDATDGVNKNKKGTVEYDRFQRCVDLLKERGAVETVRGFFGKDKRCFACGQVKVSSTRKNLGDSSRASAFNNDDSTSLSTRD